MAALFFIQSSKEMVLTDPAVEYDRRASITNGFPNVVVNNVARGRWIARSELDKSDPNVVLSLYFFNYDRPQENINWQDYEGTVAVDSGTAGAFDAKYYNPNDAELKRAYDIYRKRNVHYGRTSYGAFSSSGYGDGGYPVRVAYGSDGKVIAIAMDFVEPENGPGSNGGATPASANVSAASTQQPQSQSQLPAQPRQQQQQWQPQSQQSQAPTQSSSQLPVQSQQQAQPFTMTPEMVAAASAVNRPPNREARRANEAELEARRAAAGSAIRQVLSQPLSFSIPQQAPQQQQQQQAPLQSQFAPQNNPLFSQQQQRQQQPPAQAQPQSQSQQQQQFPQQQQQFPQQSFPQVPVVPQVPAQTSFWGPRSQTQTQPQSSQFQPQSQAQVVPQSQPQSQRRQRQLFVGNNGGANAGNSVARRTSFWG